MDKTIILGLKNAGSLGDALWLTPAICELKNKNCNVVVQMHDTEQCRWTSPIFKNLCEVQFVSSPPERLYITNHDETHSAQRVLNELKLSNINCIPKIILDRDEIDWAKNLINDYPNPIVFINDNSGTSDPTNFRAKYVKPPEALIQENVDIFLKSGHTPLQFGNIDDKKFSPLNNTVKIRGLNVRQLAACYYLIRQMISGDTGDYHLMLAANGFCLVYVPNESNMFGYKYTDLHYVPALWKNENVRVRYINFHQNIELYR